MTALATDPFVRDLKSFVDKRNANFDLHMERTQ